MDTWVVLNRALIYAACALGVTLILSTIGLAIVPREQFEVAFSVVSLIAAAEFMVGAGAFACLVMIAARETTRAPRPKGSLWKPIWKPAPANSGEPSASLERGSAWLAGKR
jgi:hypothetical protein